jgi:hypothetical protein
MQGLLGGVRQAQPSARVASHFTHADAGASTPLRPVYECERSGSGGNVGRHIAATSASWTRPLRWNERGPSGPSGPPGVAGIVTIVEQSQRDASDVKGANGNCPPGKTVLGGGANITSDDLAVPVAITSSEFNATATAKAWFAQATEMRRVASAWRVNAFVACASLLGCE